MRTIVLSPETAKDYRKRSLPPIITISRRNIIISISAMDKLQLKAGDHFFLVIEEGRLFFKYGSNSAGFQLHKSGKTREHLMSNTGPGVIVALQEEGIIEKREMHRFLIGKLKKGGLWELIPRKKGKKTKNDAE